MVSRPAQQGGGSGHPLKIYASKPAQDQAIGDALHRLLVAPAVHMLDDEQTQNGLGRGRVAPTHSGEPIAPHQVAAHLGKQEIVIEQAIQLVQHRVYLVGQFGHACEYLFRQIPIYQHGTSLQEASVYLCILPA
jgi:hypothetical protein